MRSLLSLKRPPLADCSIPHRSSSFFCRDATIRSLNVEARKDDQRLKAGKQATKGSGKRRTDSHPPSSSPSSSPHESNSRSKRTDEDQFLGDGSRFRFGGSRTTNVSLLLIHRSHRLLVLPLLLLFMDL